MAKSTVTHTQPVNVNHMSFAGTDGGIFLTFSLFFLLFHFIKHYNHSLFSLLSHTLHHIFSLTLSLSLSLSIIPLEKIKMRIKTKKTKETVRKVESEEEWRELRSPWSTASCLHCSWGSKGKTQETLSGIHIYYLTHAQVCFYVCRFSTAYTKIILSCIHPFISLS